MAHSVSLSSFGHFVGFIRVRLVHSGSPWRSLGFVGFFGARPYGGCVHSRSLGSFGRALVVVVFIRACHVD